MTEATGGLRYRRILRGVPYAEARFVGDEKAVRATLAEGSDRATFPIEVSIRDADGQETGSMTATMALRKLDR